MENSLSLDLESGNNQNNLIMCIKQDKSDLLDWSKKNRKTIKPTLIFSPSIWGVTFYAIGDEWFDFHNKLGGLEKISFKIQKVEMDINGDGKIDSEEIEKNIENCKKTIDNCLGQFANYGIIGALFVSVLYPLVLNGKVCSQITSDFFPYWVIVVFNYIHYTLIYYSLFQAFLLVYVSTRAYLQLSIWMPNIELKQWYINEITMVYFHNIYSRTMKSAVLAVPFGVVISVTPTAGLICTLITGKFLWDHTRQSKYDVKVAMKVHDFIKNKMI